MQKRGQAFICAKFNSKGVVAIGFALQLGTSIQNAHLQRIFSRQTTPWSLIQVTGFSSKILTRAFPMWFSKYRDIWHKSGFLAFFGISGHFHGDFHGPLKSIYLA